MTLMLATAFVRVTNEHLVVSGANDNVSVLNVAEAGIDAFFNDTSLVRPTDGDSVRYNVLGGYAWVFAYELQRPADTVANDVTFIIESRGTLIHPPQGNVPQAHRSLFEFARWQVGSIQTNALFTAANGINRRADGEYTLEAWDGGDNNFCQTGLEIARTRTRTSPPPADTEDGYGPVTGGVSDSAVAAETGIRWQDIVDGKFIPDHYSVQLGDTLGFTSQLIAGDLTLNSGHRGSGLLMVTGDLKTEETGGGEVEWRGIVLVGGELQTDAALTDFHGIVVTGLNEMLGISVSRSDVAGSGHDADFLYEPCFVRQALDNLTGWVRIPGSRVDNWASY